MARKTAFFGDITVSFGNVYMALVAGDAKFQIGLMGEGEPLMLHHFSGHTMAGWTASRGLAGGSPLEMADIAYLLGHRNMFPLDDLGVAACASKFHSPAEFAQMIFMIENDRTFESYLAFQDPLAVTPGLHAHLVFDLGPGARVVGIGDITG
jgi:hypothetical protein